MSVSHLSTVPEGEMASCRRCFVHISALSTFDGRVYLLESSNCDLDYVARAYAWT